MLLIWSGIVSVLDQSYPQNVIGSLIHGCGLVNTAYVEHLRDIELGPSPILLELKVEGKEK